MWLCSGATFPFKLHHSFLQSRTKHLKTFLHFSIKSHDLRKLGDFKEILGIHSTYQAFRPKF